MTEGATTLNGSAELLLAKATDEVLDRLNRDDHEHGQTAQLDGQARRGRAAAC